MIESELMILKGSHGTKESLAIKILAEHFKANSDRKSLWGKGSYFWPDRGDCHELAVEWANYRWKKDLLTERCYVLCAEISVEQSFFLDFADIRIQKKYLAFKKKFISDILSKGKILSDEDFQRLKILFINVYDKEKNKKHKVVKAPVPQGFRIKTEHEELGLPFAYIVRDLDCINAVKDNRDERHCESCNRT